MVFVRIWLQCWLFPPRKNSDEDTLWWPHSWKSCEMVSGQWADDPGGWKLTWLDAAAMCHCYRVSQAKWLGERIYGWHMLSCFLCFLNSSSWHLFGAIRYSGCATESDEGVPKALCVQGLLSMRVGTPFDKNHVIWCAFEPLGLSDSLCLQNAERWKNLSIISIVSGWNLRLYTRYRVGPKIWCARRTVPSTPTRSPSTPYLQHCFLQWVLILLQVATLQFALFMFLCHLRWQMSQRWI